MVWIQPDPGNVVINQVGGQRLRDPKTWVTERADAAGFVGGLIEEDRSF